MLYFRINAAGAVTEIADKAPSPFGPDWANRWDWKDLPSAQKVAASATEHAGERYIAIDNGGGCYPRFDVIRAPKVGDQVSYSFNGDSYPDGEIKSISASLRLITTTTGGTYYRRGESGRWVKKGGTWTLIRGHVNEHNREF